MSARTGTAWSHVDLMFLRQEYTRNSNEILSRVLGRSPKAIGLQARKMGLKKSAEFMAQECRRIRPGDTPWNKGLPGSTGTQEGCRATQFKPGRRPEEARNYRPIGSLRLGKDGLMEMKVTDDQSIASAQRWRSVHQVVWERHCGPVPAGSIIVFKPGMRTTDPALITVDRLECITRAENMRRNTVHRYGPEIAQIHQLRGAIARKINERAKREEEAPA